MFKITFNKPAVKAFFAGEDAVGVELNFENDKVMFRPVATFGPEDMNVVPVSAKLRGGLEAVIEGSREAEVKGYLINPGLNPYFTLVRRAGGWMEAVPYVDGPAPGRFVPHIRTWDMTATPPGTYEETIIAPTPLPPSEKAREALVQMEGLFRNISRGDPLKAVPRVAEAQEWMRVFTQAIRENVTAPPAPKAKRVKAIPPSSKTRARAVSKPAGQQVSMAFASHRPSRRDRAFATSYR